MICVYNRYHSSWIDGDNFYIMTELCEGGALFGMCYICVCVYVYFLYENVLYIYGYIVIDR